MNKIIRRDKLEKSEWADKYALELEKMYEDVVHVPMFEDKEIELEEWSLGWFHIETQKEIEWTILVSLSVFINATGMKVSDVLSNETFKKHAFLHESVVLGKQVKVSNDLSSLVNFEVEVDIELDD